MKVYLKYILTYINVKTVCDDNSCIERPLVSSELSRHVTTCAHIIRGIFIKLMLLVN